MSFLSSAFSGASNNFTPQTTSPQIQTANANYGQANTGFNSLAAALQQQMSGQGPNLANQQLQNATGQNVAQQAALMAGQRGASANVGLMARQIGQQGAGIQQQAAGQSASNVLAQQLAAQAQLGNVYGQQAGAANQNYSISQGGLNNYNQVGSGIASENAKQNAGILGGIGDGVSSLAGQMFSPKPPGGMGNTAGGPDAGQLASAALMFASQGGQVPSYKFLQRSPSTVHKYANGGEVNHDMMLFHPVDMKTGGTVPGQPMQPGKNVPSNDTQPAMLTPQEIVLPLSVTQHPNAPQEAAKFVAAELAKRGRK